MRTRSVGRRDGWGPSDLSELIHLGGSFAYACQVLLLEGSSYSNRARMSGIYTHETGLIRTDLKLHTIRAQLLFPELKL